VSRILILRKPFGGSCFCQEAVFMGTIFLEVILWEAILWEDRLGAAVIWGRNRE
jgi:hypothetical protein